MRLLLTMGDVQYHLEECETCDYLIARDVPIQSLTPESLRKVIDRAHNIRARMGQS